MRADARQVARPGSTCAHPSSAADAVARSAIVRGRLGLSPLGRAVLMRVLRGVLPGAMQSGFYPRAGLPSVAFGQELEPLSPADASACP